MLAFFYLLCGLRNHFNSSLLADEQFEEKYRRPPHQGGVAYISLMSKKTSGMTTREAKISEEQGSMDADLSVGDEVEVFLSEIEVEG